MAGISSSVGLISGIDTATLINQLLSIEARPRTLAQQRIAGLQLQQTAYLDLNSKLNALKTAASKFRTSKSVQSKLATSSNDKALRATASTSAASGTYQFLVDRLVSSQQSLSRGFADRNSTSVGATTLTFEEAMGGITRDTALADLNGGAGIARGKITISDSQGGTATVDLSKVATVSEVLEAINSATGISVTARTEGGRFVVADNAGGSITIANAVGSTTATSLGLAGSGSGQVTGASVYSLGQNTALGALNDGNGVFFTDTIGVARHDFKISIDGATTVNVNIGPTYDAQGNRTGGEASTIGQVIERMNQALADAGFTDITASVGSDGTRLRIVDQTGARSIAVTENGSGTTARDLGLLTTAPATGTLDGARVFAGMNTTLLKNINGGAGLGSDGSIAFTLRDGSAFNLSLSNDATLDEISAQITAASGTLMGGGAKLSVFVNDSGTGLRIVDNTAGSDPLVISGGAAAALGIETTGAEDGVVKGSNLQHAYITGSTLVSKLNGGRGIGTGIFEIRDSTGGTVEVNVGTDTKNVAQLIAEINSNANGAGLRVRARINENGDGFELYEQIPTGETAGSTRIQITDKTGGVAAALRIAGEAKGTDTENVIRGSYERTVEIDADDTLDDMISKINSAGVGVAASIVNDGTGATPFRVSLSARASGSAGRVLFDSGSIDLGLTTLDKGNDARIFFGGTDPATGLLLSSSSNTFNNVITGVTVDALSVSADPVQLSITQNTEGIVADVKAFLDAFNTVVSRIDEQSKYTQETNRRGPLLGDSTAQTLRQTLFSTIQKRAIGATGQYDTLADIGVRFGSAGKLELNEERFREALAADPTSVENVLAGYVQDEAEQFEDLGNGIKVKISNPRGGFSVLGVAGQLEQMINSYVDTVDGVLTGRKKSIDEQVAFQNRRISQIDQRLSNRRSILERQFVAMEQAISQLQQQQSSINQLRSFS